MDDVSRFVGIWRVEPVAPFSGHTFTWELDASRLRGRWTIEAADFPESRAAKAAGLPTEFAMQVGEPWLASGALLFTINGGPYPWEFRVTDDAHAVVGAALSELPADFVAEHQRSIAGHRMLLTRQR